MFRYFTLLTEPLKVPMMYQKRLGSGRRVLVVVSDEGLELDNLIVRFERKIERSDVVDGKLVRISHEEVKHRGAKRSTTITLSIETAEALHLTLGRALRDARKRHLWHELSNRMMSNFFETLHVLDDLKNRNHLN